MIFVSRFFISKILLTYQAIKANTTLLENLQATLCPAKLAM